METPSLNELIEKAHELKNINPDLNGLICEVSSIDFGNVMRKLLWNRIKEGKFVSREAIVCGDYISNLLTMTIEPGEEFSLGWRITNHLEMYEESKKPSMLLRGADLCFLIHSIFPRRTLGRKEVFTFSDYERFGKQLYSHHYAISDLEHSKLMSKYFYRMSTITRDSLVSLKGKGRILRVIG